MQKEEKKNNEENRSLNENKGGFDLQSQENNENLDIKKLDVLSEVFGKFGDFTSSFEEKESFSTGSIILDETIGNNGYLRGSIIELFGPYHSGKTTLALYAIREQQKRGNIALYIDAENSFDYKYATHIGIDCSTLLIFHPKSAEAAFDFIYKILNVKWKNGKVLGLIVVDSVSGLIPSGELESSSFDVQPISSLARIMSRGIKKLSHALVSTRRKIVHTSIIFINQLRQNINTSPFSYGEEKEFTTGGGALKYFAHLRIKTSKRKRIENGGKVDGVELRFSIDKNKYFDACYKLISVYISSEKGIDKNREVFTLSEERGIIRRSGATYYFGEKKLGVGREKTIRFIEDNKDIFDQILSIISEKTKKINNF